MPNRTVPAVLAAASVAAACGLASPAAADVRGKHMQAANMQPDVMTRPDGTRRIAGLDAPGAKAVYCDLRETGANHVTLTWPLTQKTTTSTHITLREPNLAYGRIGSMSEKQIRRAIRNARACGLKVVLKPHLEVDDNTWRGRIGAEAWAHDDKAADAWQREWEKWLLRYAKIARTEKGVDQLVLGTEQWGTVLAGRNGVAFNPHNPARWAKTAKKVKTALRKTKQGRKVHVTYALHTGYEAAGFPKVFAKQLWELGFTWYPNRDVTDQSLAGQTAAMRADFDKKLAPLHKRTGRKLFAAEVGFASLKWESRYKKRAEQTPDDVDMARQATQYRAALTVLDATPYVDGAMIYRVGNVPDAGGPNDAWLNVQGKTAEGVVADFFGGHVPGRAK